MSVCSPVAVIGAGNVGCALAADLGLRGVEVRLFNRSPGRLAAIRDAGGITVTGQIEGFAAPALVTGSLEAGRRWRRGGGRHRANGVVAGLRGRAGPGDDR